MSRRLLAWCLLAYPRASRAQDGDYLLDLALELAGGSGLVRQAASLLRGGLLERLRQGRRRGRRGAALALAGTVAATLVVIGLAVTQVGTVDVEVEVEQCAGC